MGFGKLGGYCVASKTKLGSRLNNSQFKNLRYENKSYCITKMGNCYSIQEVCFAFNIINIICRLKVLSFAPLTGLIGNTQ